MKKYLILFALMTGLMNIQQIAFACGLSPLNVDIDGPSERCELSPGIPTVYTGFHNFPSNDCIIYEWTISGGTIMFTSEAGTPNRLTNGTLCIVENGFCFADLVFECTAATTDPAVANSNGASVVVIWNEGEENTLSLTVREMGSVILSKHKEISVHLTMPVLTSLSPSN